MTWNKKIVQPAMALVVLGLVAASPAHAAPIVIDNGGAGYSQTGFTNQGSATAFNSTQAFNSTANNGGFATWSFTGLADGTYEIYATWDQDGQGNLTTAAPYSFAPTGGTGSSTTVNQESVGTGPDADLIIDDTDASGTLSFDFEKLGAVTVKAGQLDVRLDAVTGGGSSDFVFADAVAIEAVTVPTGLLDTVDWTTAGGAGSGVNGGTLGGATVNLTSAAVGNAGVNFGTTWATQLGTDDALPGGVTNDEAAAIGGLTTGQTVTVDLTGGRVVDPILLFNFGNGATSLDFGDLPVTLLDSSTAALGGSVVTFGAAGNSANDGFAVQLLGEYSSFSFVMDVANNNNTLGFSFGGNVVPAPAALPTGLALIAAVAMRRRRNRKA